MLLGTQDKDFFPVDLTEKFNFIQSSGFDCYEIDGSLILNRFDEVKAARAMTKLNIVSVCGGYRGWIGDFIEERRKNAVKDISLHPQTFTRNWCQRYRRSGCLGYVHLPPASDGLPTQ